MKLLTTVSRMRRASDHPIVHGIEPAAVHALCLGVLGRAGDTRGFEHVEGLAALSARPVFSQTGGAVWQVGQAKPSRRGSFARRKRARAAAAPAVHEHEGGESTVPDGLRPDGETDESRHSIKPKIVATINCVLTHHKPEKGSENLTAIQRIDRKDVERQQADINPEDRVQNA